MSDETENLVSISKQDVRRAREDLNFLSSIEDIIEEARNGRMFILVDDEERENERIWSFPRKWRPRTLSISWRRMDAV